MHVRLLAPLVFILVIGAASPPNVRLGLTPGQRPGPYSSVVSVGAERGQSHCYICDTADRPAVVVFARTPPRPSANWRADSTGAKRSQGVRNAGLMTFLNAIRRPSTRSCAVVAPTWSA